MQNAEVTCGDGNHVVVFEKLSQLPVGSRSKQRWHDGFFFAFVGEPESFEVSVECVAALFGFR